MREIKFRGKDKYEVWHYGGYVDYMGKPRIVNEVNDGPLYALATEQVIPETLGQYTGLRDKNGVEIYEGDIVRSTWGGSPGVVRIGTYNDGFLEYAPTICGVYCSEIGANNDFGLTQYFTDEVEVLSNIHDSPELLKGEASC